MHELGVVFYIIKDVKAVAEENHVDHVSSVVMDIGEVSTVVPHLLTDCWRWAADKEEMLKGCELKINTIPAVTYCDNCKKEYETVKFGKTCPHCNSNNTWLLRGNDTSAIRKSNEKNNRSDHSAFARHLPALEKMLWGGSVMLVVDHIINGELTWRFPFFTALENAGGGAVMLREMLTVGVPMSIVITAVWAVYAILKSRVPKSRVSSQLNN